MTDYYRVHAPTLNKGQGKDLKNLSRLDTSRHRPKAFWFQKFFELVDGLSEMAHHPCGNFSGTSSLKFRGTKGSIGHTFMVCIHTENQNQGDFYPFVLLEISVLHESPLGHLRYGLTDVPPQPNSPPDNVFNPDQPARDLNARSWAVKPSSASLNK